MKFDIEKIKEAGYKITTPIIAAGVSDSEKISILAKKEVKVGQRLFKIN